MSEIDYAKILRAYMSEVTGCEGTDFLGSKNEPCSLAGLTPSESEELTRIRDEVRTADGWPEYAATPQGER